ncbi:MAG: cupredoxin domain-containing protein [Egibacteraceae bacterium]
MSSIRISLLGLVAALAVAGTACTPQEPDVTPEEQVGAAQRPEEPAENGEDAGDDAEGEGGGETVTFVAEDILFADAPSEVPAGSVTFELLNDGSADHDVTIDDLGGEPIVEAPGGETATGTAELEPGEYEYYCSVPGHKSSMNGTFTVTE